jgi:hypothetical protein
VTLQTDAPIACDPTAISPDQQESWVKVVKDIYRAVEEVQELPDGYAFRLPARGDVLMLAAEEINFERLCCPFLHFNLEVPPNSGPIWLRFTGGAGAKEFLRMGFESGDLLDPHVAQAAGLNTANATRLDSVATVLDTISELNDQFASRA